MRRIKLVFGVAAVMVAMLVAFAAPAMADHDDDDEFVESHPVIPILENALGVDLSEDDDLFWISDDGTIWTSEDLEWTEGWA